MTVSIANMTQVWMSNSNVYNAISMSISTLGYGANTNSKVLNFSVDGNTVFNVDTVGTQYSRPNTVAVLPSPTLGSRSFVTDANNTTFNTRVFGGGSNAVPVFSNGTYWLIG
jgi:hypothetical protein